MCTHGADYRFDGTESNTADRESSTGDKSLEWRKAATRLAATRERAWQREAVSGSTGHGVALGAEIRGEIALHDDGGSVRHGIEMREELGKKLEAVLSDSPRGFVAVLVVFEAVLDGQARHPDVNAGLGRITPWIGTQHGRVFGDGGIEQDHVNVVMMLRRWWRGASRAARGSHWQRMR